MFKKLLPFMVHIKVRSLRIQNTVPRDIFVYLSFVTTQKTEEVPLCFMHFYYAY